MVAEPGNLQGHLPTSAHSGGHTQYFFNESALQSNLSSDRVVVSVSILTTDATFKKICFFVVFIQKIVI